MGERLNKTRVMLQHAREKIIENTKRNIYMVLICVYLIGMTIWNMSTLYVVGDIDLRLFYILIIDGFNTPIFIVTGLVLTGKTKMLQLDNESTRTITTLERDIALAKQENENLKEIQQLNNIIGDLNEQLHKQKESFLEKLGYEREIAEYRCQIAARDGKVPDAIESNKDWNDSNKTIKIMEESEQSSDPPK